MTEDRGWFNEAQFGLFIHWGIYSVPAGSYDHKHNYGEWILLNAKIPPSVYHNYSKELTGEGFDAKQIVNTALACGMKYIVFTAKHHDGFCMFHTKHSDYNIKITPFGRDPLQELTAACKGRLKLGIYYSLTDWHHPAFPAAFNTIGFHEQEKNVGDIAAYAVYVTNQLTELLTNYGDVALLWFDGRLRGEDSTRFLNPSAIEKMIRKLQPNCLINNRLKGIEGDFLTMENTFKAEIVASDAKRRRELCIKHNNHWGYNTIDEHFKTAQTLRILLQATSDRNTNLLLNIAPDKQGRINPKSLKILRELGLVRLPPRERMTIQFHEGSMPRTGQFDFISKRFDQCSAQSVELSSALGKTVIASLVGPAWVNGKWERTELSIWLEVTPEFDRKAEIPMYVRYQVHAWIGVPLRISKA